MSRSLAVVWDRLRGVHKLKCELRALTVQATKGLAGLETERRLETERSLVNSGIKRLKKLRGERDDLLSEIEFLRDEPSKSKRDLYRDRWMAVAKLHLTLLDVEMPPDHYLDKSELEERYPK